MCRLESTRAISDALHSTSSWSSSPCLFAQCHWEIAYMGCCLTQHINSNLLLWIEFCTSCASPLAPFAPQAPLTDVTIVKVIYFCQQVSRTQSWFCFAYSHELPRFYSPLPTCHLTCLLIDRLLPFWASTRLKVWVNYISTLLPTQHSLSSVNSCMS